MGVQLKIAGYRFRDFLCGEKRLLLLSVCLGVLIVLATRVYADVLQRGIAERVVRFHVLANSDSAEDQALKLKVRDKVLSYMRRTMEQSGSKQETLTILEKNKEEIARQAAEVIKKEGYSYRVKVFLARDLFPYKEYGDVTFPAGQYDALRVEIGRGEGRNWWCVMFPPLCYTDEGEEAVTEESKAALRSILTKEEYAVVMANEEEAALAPQVKLKVVEWWQEKEADKSKYVTKK